MVLWWCCGSASMWRCGGVIVGTSGMVMLWSGEYIGRCSSVTVVCRMVLWW